MICFVIELNSLGLLCTAAASSDTLKMHENWNRNVLAGVRCVAPYYACLSLNWFAKKFVVCKSWLTPSANTGQAIERRQWNPRAEDSLWKWAWSFFFSQSNEFCQRTRKLQTVPIKGIFCSFPLSPREKNGGESDRRKQGREMQTDAVMTAVNCVPNWLPRGISLAFIITRKLASAIGAQL